MSLTPEQRSAFASHAARSRLAKMTPAERTELARKMALAKWARLTAEQRSEHNRPVLAARWSKATPAQRSVRAKRQWDRIRAADMDAKALAWLAERGLSR